MGISPLRYTPLLNNECLVENMVFAENVVAVKNVPTTFSAISSGDHNRVMGERVIVLSFWDRNMIFPLIK